MIKWTTPTLTCTIPPNIDFEYIILTLKQNEIVLNKRIEKEQVNLGRFDVSFTQEETGQFDKLFNIEAQLNIINGDVRLGTNIETIMITKNLYDEVIINE